MATNDYEDLLRQDAAAAAAAQSTGAPTYAGTYEGQLSDIFDRIQNREQFAYDVNADPLYQQYKDKYVTQGKTAMKDTMGQAAGLTGGYGSTYSAQVGQQTYDSYLQNLSDVIPELYGMAYDKYRDEGDDLANQFGMVGQMRDTEYNMYRDALGDWNYQQETDYAHQQQAYANLVALISKSGYNPTDAELAAAGLTREAASALRQEYLRANGLLAPASSGGGGGGGGGSGSGTKKSSAGSPTSTKQYTTQQKSAANAIVQATEAARNGQLGSTPIENQRNLENIIGAAVGTIRGTSTPTAQQMADAYKKKQNTTTSTAKKSGGSGGGSNKSRMSTK